jgi:hypothetical protein
LPIDDFRLPIVDFPIANLQSAIGNENLVFGCGRAAL